MRVVIKRKTKLNQRIIKLKKRKDAEKKRHTCEYKMEFYVFIKQHGLSADEKINSKAEHILQKAREKVNRHISV